MSNTRAEFMAGLMEQGMRLGGAMAIADPAGNLSGYKITVEQAPRSSPLEASRVTRYTIAAPSAVDAQQGQSLRLPRRSLVRPAPSLADTATRPPRRNATASPPERRKA